MFRYALSATLIVGGFLVVLAASFEEHSGVAPGEHSGVAPRREKMAALRGQQSSTGAGYAASVTNSQSQLQAKTNAMLGALRSATARQLQELEAAIRGPEAPTAVPPAAPPPVPRPAAPAVAASIPEGTRPPVAVSRAPQVVSRPVAVSAAPRTASPPDAAARPPRSLAEQMSTPPPRRPVASAAPRKSVAEVPPAHSTEMPPAQIVSRPGTVTQAAPEVPRARREPPAIVQLVSADQALQSNDPVGARGLLEAAETSVVFAPAAGDSRGNSVAAAQITEALRMVEAGDRAQAMQCVAQAVAALRRRQHVSAQR
jgi:hypothetical protein